MDLAHANTVKDIETCGILAGTLVKKIQGNFLTYIEKQCVSSYDFDYSQTNWNF